MKIAVVGGKYFTNTPRMKEVLDRLEPAMVVSGGEIGADHLAYLYAHKEGVVFCCQPPIKEDAERYGVARASSRRNLRIVLMSDYIVAFPDERNSRSRDIHHIIRLAKKFGIPGKIIAYK